MARGTNYDTEKSVTALRSLPYCQIMAVKADSYVNTSKELKQIYPFWALTIIIFSVLMRGKWPGNIIISSDRFFKR